MECDSTNGCLIEIGTTLAVETSNRAKIPVFGVKDSEVILNTGAGQGEKKLLSVNFICCIHQYFGVERVREFLTSMSGGKNVARTWLSTKIVSNKFKRVIFIIFRESNFQL